MCWLNVNRRLQGEEKDGVGGKEIYAFPDFSGLVSAPVFRCDNLGSEFSGC